MDDTERPSEGCGYNETQKGTPADQPLFLLRLAQDVPELFETHEGKTISSWAREAKRSIADQKAVTKEVPTPLESATPKVLGSGTWTVR